MGHLLDVASRVLGRRITASVALLFGSFLVLVSCIAIVVTAMSLGGGLVIGYVAAGAAFFSIAGSWFITRTIQWIRSTARSSERTGP